MGTMEVTPNETETTQPEQQKETPLESLASICSVLAIGLFVMTFIFQNFEIPSASMVQTLLIGDHVLVDRITLAPPAKFPSSTIVLSSPETSALLYSIPTPPSLEEISTMWVKGILMSQTNERRIA